MMININLIFISFFLIPNLIYCIVKIDRQKSELKNKPNATISLNTSLGTLIGYKQNVLDNKIINVFYGIPYGEKPIGKLRFKETKLVNRFPNRIYNATDFKPHCAMVINSLIYHKDDQFSEDCLYLNIWTPNLESIKKADGTCTKNFSTMIYILGGKNKYFNLI